MGQLEEKLRQALKDKDNDISSYIWKFPKERTSEGLVLQREVKLTDCTVEELQQFYAHAHSMLTSRDKTNPGRLVLLKDIIDQQLRCSTELFLRHSESIGNSRIAILDAIKISIANNNYGIIDTKNLLLSDLVNVPTEYRGVPIPMIIDGCKDQLGRFDRRHITFSFILKQGLWFTKEELRDLYELDEHNTERDKKEVIKERLKLSPDINLIITPLGLSYTQFRAMNALKSRKYSELTTEQLKTLRKRILYNLEDDVKKHIYFWEKKIVELNKVLESKAVSVK
jgi:hypothetical protein